MLNAEKYRNEILAMIEKGERLALRANNPTVVESCDDSIMCDNCLFNDGICHFSRMKWLLSEYKEPVKLTRLEYDILKYLLNETEYKYIVRDKKYHEDGVFYLFIFKNTPREYSEGWHTNDPYDRTQFYAFNNLFQFVQWEDEKPTSIKEVLENCEVVEGAEK